jgi:glycosyltransferase involved in cell wall biosynthesis
MFTTDNPRRLPRRQTNCLSRIRLAIVSPTPPRPCPVATYTDELCRMLPAVAPRIGLTVYAIDHGDGRPTIAGRPVPGSIAVDDPSAYRRAGQRLQRLGADVVLIEVGPGTAGGPHGRYLLGLTDELTRLGVPYLVAPHQVRPSPSPDDANMLSALCRNAVGVVALSDSARRALASSRIVAPRRVAVVPSRPAPELLIPPRGRPAALAGCGAGPVLLTMGHLSPARGVDTVIAALPALAAAHPGIRYVVSGRTLASATRAGSGRYRRALVDAARALRVDHRLIIVDRDLPLMDAAALLHAADVYVAPDLDLGRTDDGPLANAVALGLRVVATNTPFAEELLGDQPDAVVAPGDPGALAGAVERVLATARPAASHRSSAHTAEQIAGLVALVASPRPAPPLKTPATRRRTAAA